MKMHPRCALKGCWFPVFWEVIIFLWWMWQIFLWAHFQAFLKDSKGTGYLSGWVSCGFPRCFCLIKYSKIKYCSMGGRWRDGLFGRAINSAVSWNYINEIEATRRCMWEREGQRERDSPLSYSFQVMKMRLCQRLRCQNWKCWNKFTN